MLTYWFTAINVPKLLSKKKACENKNLSGFLWPLRLALYHSGTRGPFTLNTLEIPMLSYLQNAYLLVCHKRLKIMMIYNFGPFNYLHEPKQYEY